MYAVEKAVYMEPRDDEGEQKKREYYAEGALERPSFAAAGNALLFRADQLLFTKAVM